MSAPTIDPSDARCSVIVNRGDSRWSNRQPCGRLAERDGKCKLHLAVEARRVEKDARWVEKQARGDALQDEAVALSAALGFAVKADYSWVTSSHTGDFVVSGDWLREQARASEPKAKSAPSKPNEAA